MLIIELYLLSNSEYFKRSVQDEIFDFFAHMLLLYSNAFDVLSLIFRKYRKRYFLHKNKSGFATYYHMKLLLIFQKYRERYFLHNKKGRCSRCPSHLRARPCNAFIFYCAVMYALSFNYDSCSLSAADAECCQTSLGISLLHLVDQ